LQSLVFIRGAGVEIPENQGARIALSEKNEHRGKKTVSRKIWSKNVCQSLFQFQTKQSSDSLAPG